MARKKLGEMLLEAGVIDQTGLRAALVEQRRWGGHLGRVLIDMKLVSEEQLVGVLSRQLGIGTVEVDKLQIPQAVIDLLHRETVRALAREDVRQKLAAIGFEPIGGTPAEFSARIRIEVPKWTKLIRDANIKPE